MENKNVILEEQSRIESRSSCSSSSSACVHSSSHAVSTVTLHNPGINDNYEGNDYNTGKICRVSSASSSGSSGSNLESDELDKPFSDILRKKMEQEHVLSTDSRCLHDIGAQETHRKCIEDSVDLNFNRSPYTSIPDRNGVTVIKQEDHQVEDHSSDKGLSDDQTSYGLHPDNEISSSSTPAGGAISSSMQSSSPTSSGVQHSKTTQGQCSSGIDGIEKLHKTGSFVRGCIGKEKENDGDNKRAAGGKLSKKKQKKLMKRIMTINPNGTIELNVNGSSQLGHDLFGPEAGTQEDETEYPQDEGEEGRTIPPLQIVMLIVGTRGDVQPFVAIGKHLQEYGHRVRLATHSNFEDFVLRAGLEFYPLGGNPKVLAEYMVKNKGVLPSGPSEIRIQRKELKSIIYSLLPACIESYKNSVKFRAQAIIANPPTYGHVHVAEALNIPMHIFFTMPWTPTSEFPHPLARVHHAAANRLSYQLVDAFIWWGIRDLINDFRKRKLKLRPITYLSGSQIPMSKLPTGYIWSPQLVPKPKDWGPLIDVVGFCFLDLSRDYKPPESLVDWLAAGPAPIYVGFGSLPVEDPEGMTEIIVQALLQTKQRGIINKGWGGIGNSLSITNDIYPLENCPHDWLFPQCAAVVHHGGAGTTAAGLKAACPTTIVPFFGDQPFWGDRVHAKGVGPAPIPVGHFCLEKLVDAISFMMKPEVKEKAVKLAQAMESEDGVAGAVDAFHRHLPKEMPMKHNSVRPVQSVQSKKLVKHFPGLKLFSCFY